MSPERPQDPTKPATAQDPGSEVDGRSDTEAEPGGVVFDADWRKEEKPTDPLDRYRHKEVVVQASGFTYRGTLLGADESEIYLRSQTRYVTVRWSRVTKIQLADEQICMDPLKQVDPSFYDLSDLEPAQDDDGATPQAERDQED